MESRSLGTFTVDVELRENGLFDVYLAHEGSSGAHYVDVPLEKIGELVSDLVDCVAENVNF